MARRKHSGSLIADMLGWIFSPGRRESRAGKIRRGRRRRNPDRLSMADRQALEKAERMSEAFHGTPDLVIELDDHERRLPKFLVALGSIPELSYEPRADSARANSIYVHKSGDRGLLEPSSKKKPVLAADPISGKPVIVAMGSGIHMTRDGLKG